MYFHNVVGIGSYITSTTNMYNKYFTHGRDGAPVRVTSFRKQCFDGLAVHVSDKLVLLPQCPCLSRERVVAQYLNIDVHRLTDFYRKRGVNIRQNEGKHFFWI